jgi:hypothetical protein
MYLASAYPNSDLSAGDLTLLALVMVLSLAVWLIVVFRADRQRPTATKRTKSSLNVAALSATAEDKQGDVSHVPADHQHGAAA